MENHIRHLGLALHIKFSCVKQSIASVFIILFPLCVYARIQNVLQHYTRYNYMTNSCQGIDLNFGTDTDNLVTK